MLLQVIKHFCAWRHIIFHWLQMMHEGQEGEVQAIQIEDQLDKQQWRQRI
jgi:hypothetical protein